MRALPRRSFRGAVTVLALSAVALLGTAGAAMACNTGDNRPHPIPGKNPAACSKSESGITPDDVDFEGGEGTKSLTIKALHDGVKVTRIVVMGGNDGFNEYVPGKVGKGGEKFPESAPWNNLVAPYNYGDDHATKIDKWYLCGSKEETKPPTETTTSKPAPTTSAKPTETTSAPSSSDTTKPAAPAGNESGGSGGGLANTGFDNAWLIGVAALLLLAGGGLLVLLRVRRKAGN